MNVCLIGNQISKFRKRLNMTQEELGCAVGVSTQAVSRWECGGAPDITLLPVIADTLHVSIDALFGREDIGSVDIKENLIHYFASLPQNKLFDELVDFSWIGIQAMFMNDYGINDVGLMEKAEVDFQGQRHLSKSIVTSSSGMLLCSYAKDLRYTLVLPEPEEGYAHFFASKEEYKQLFSALSLPLALDIILELCSERQRYMSVAAIRKRLQISPDDIEKIQLLEKAIEALYVANILIYNELEVEESILKTYSLPCQEYLPFFFILSRYITQKGGLNHIGNYIRNEPWLKKNIQNGE